MLVGCDSDVEERSLTQTPEGNADHTLSNNYNTLAAAIASMRMLNLNLFFSLEKRETSAISAENSFGKGRKIFSRASQSRA
jgi:hypothetical protein